MSQLRHVWRSMLVFAWLVLAVPVSVGVLASQPNILLIYVDDLGWRDVGFMGSDFYETPNLDRLAKEGLVFTDAYSGAANCAPARACLLSGQYSPRHRIFNVGTRPRGRAEHRRLIHVPGVKTLDPRLKTWAHRLQAVGYRTATMGKWHLSDDPLSYGFDVNIGGTHAGGPPQGYYPPHGQVPGLKDAPAGEYVTDRLNEEAIQFIQENRDRPWMLYLTHFAVHTPLNAKRELVEKYKRKSPGKLHQHVAMATMIEAVDQGVGKIMAVLKQLKIDEQTVVMFYSDNGGYGPATDMAPLKGYKGTYYEGGIRVPFLVHWPGRVKPGRTDVPLTGVDLYPTFCELAGIQLPVDQQPLDGISLVPFLTGREPLSRERPLFWHFPAYLQSYPKVHDEQRDPLFRTRPCSIVRKGDWKLHQYYEDGAIELYNLKDDVGETQNLVDRKPEKKQELLSELTAWQQRVQAPVPRQPNPAFDAATESKAIQKRRAQSK